MERGKITTIRPDGGFCFIRPDDGRDDAFCHVSKFPKGTTFDDSLIGRAVDFEKTRGEKGWAAVRVRLIELQEAAS